MIKWESVSYTHLICNENSKWYVILDQPPLTVVPKVKFWSLTAICYFTVYHYILYHIFTGSLSTFSNTVLNFGFRAYLLNRPVLLCDAKWLVSIWPSVLLLVNLRSHWLTLIIVDSRSSTSEIVRDVHSVRTGIRAHGHIPMLQDLSHVAGLTEQTDNWMFQKYTPVSYTHLDVYKRQV